MRLLVSACLLGLRCRYDGESKASQAVLGLRDHYELIPVCPEQLGGLPTPRPPAEIREGRAINRQGRDVTAAYQKGAEETVRLYRLLCCQGAILKARSPSCGLGQVYDGTFSGTLTEGSGFAVRELLRAGALVATEETFADYFPCPPIDTTIQKGE